MVVTSQPSATPLPSPVDRGALREIIEEHVEELTILWHIREDRLRSTQHRLTDLVRLDERADAHADAICVAGEHAVEWLRGHVHSEDPAAVFASVYCGLRGGMRSLMPEIWPALADCTAGNAAGFAAAVANAPGDAWAGPIAELARRESLAGVVALEILARRGRRPDKPPGIDAALDSPLEEVRLWAWHALRFDLDVSEETWSRAGREASSPVRWAALEAEAWRGRRGLVERLRTAALEGTDDVSPMALASLARPEDAEVVRRAVERIDSPARRCQIWGAWGHPDAIPRLIDLLGHDDAQVAVAAARALTRITGWDIDGTETIQLPPEDAAPDDEFARAFDETVVLPDAQRAKSSWEAERKRFESSSRWNRGIDLVGGFAEARMAQVDLETLRAACLRARLAGEPSWSLARLEAFPQPRLPRAAG
jgi:uncharacterized protein (TIGR02270 family)